MRFSVSKEKNHSCQVAEPSHPEGCAIGEVLCHYASEYDAKADSRLPSREECAVGCAALRVGGKVDEHRLKGREHVSVAQADDEGCSVEAPGIVQGCKKQIAEEGDDDADGGIPYDASFPQASCSYQSARDETNAKQREEEACAGRDAEFLLCIDGDVSAYDAVGEAVACDAKCLGPTFQQEEAVEGNWSFCRFVV